MLRTGISGQLSVCNFIVSESSFAYIKWSKLPFVRCFISVNGNVCTIRAVRKIVTVMCYACMKKRYKREAYDGLKILASLSTTCMILSERIDRRRSLGRAFVSF